MKKLLSLIVMLVAYSTIASAQTFAPLYGTRLELKNGDDKTIIYPPSGVLGANTFSLTLPTSAGSDGQVLGIISGSQLGWITPAGTGVTSITGTTDQVIVDVPTGAVTLSLPQSIGTTSTPTFNNVTLTNASLQNHFAYINNSGLVTAFGPASPTLSTFAAALTGLLPVANGGTGLGTGDLSGQTGKAIVVNVGETGYTFASITGGTVTSVAANSPLSITGTATVNPTVNIANAAADGATKGAASFATNDFDASSGNISIDYANGQVASGSQNGFLSSSSFTSFSGKLTTVTADAPLSGSGTSGSHLVIANAAADGTTKGAASFTANDFNATSGNISIDYANGQVASGSQNGFLSSSSFTTFSGKQDALSGGSANSVTKWTSASAIGTSTITDNGTTVSTTGNLSTDGNLSLAGSNKTLSFKGNGTGVSTFVAGTQGTTSYNYTLPTTTPTANQVLTATSVSAPNVTLGWSTPSGGSSPTYNVLIKTGDQTVTNGTLTDATDLSVALGANENWMIEGYFYMHNTGANGVDGQAAFLYSGTLITDGLNIAGLNNGGGGAGDKTVHVMWTALNTGETFNVDGGNDYVVLITGTVRTSTAGTFKVRFAEGTAGGGGDNCIMKKGSTLKMIKY